MIARAARTRTTTPTITPATRVERTTPRRFKASTAAIATNATSRDCSGHTYSPMVSAAAEADAVLPIKNTTPASTPANRFTRIRP